ncbi:MAG: hypothetical protein IT391_02725 [Nitrospira sp.]|nr:hypothetical protein [Nitrospira sp.]
MWTGLQDVSGDTRARFQGVTDSSAGASRTAQAVRFRTINPGDGVARGFSQCVGKVVRSFLENQHEVSQEEEQVNRAEQDVRTSDRKG